MAEKNTESGESNKFRELLQSRQEKFRRLSNPEKIAHLQAIMSGYPPDHPQCDCIKRQIGAYSTILSGRSSIP